MGPKYGTMVPVSRQERSQPSQVVSAHGEPFGVHGTATGNTSWAESGPASCLLPRASHEGVSDQHRLSSAPLSPWEAAGSSYCLSRESPRVALGLQLHPRWPQKMGHYPVTLPLLPEPRETQMPASTAGTRWRLLTTEPRAHDREARAVPGGQLRRLTATLAHSDPRGEPRAPAAAAALLGRSRAVKQSGVRKSHFLQHQLLCSTLCKMC